MPHKLLLADDSVTIQRVIELTFADEDVQVVAVGDGKKAIASIQADRPDIVLADVGMPERDGYEVAAFIKGTAELAHIPVLLLTGAFEPIDETRARAVGCDGVLVKPFEPQMVISRVKDLLAGRKPAGLWAASPAAQTPLRQPAPRAGVDVRGPRRRPPRRRIARGLFRSARRRVCQPRRASRRRRRRGGCARAAAADRVHAAVRLRRRRFRHRYQAPAAYQVPAAAISPLDDLSGWDPDLAGDPKTSARFEPAAIATEPPRAPAPAIVPPCGRSAPPAPAPRAAAAAPPRSASGAGRRSGAGRAPRSGASSRSGFRVRARRRGRRSRGAHAVAGRSVRDAAVRRTGPAASRHRRLGALRS